MRRLHLIIFFILVSRAFPWSGGFGVGSSGGDVTGGAASEAGEVAVYADTTGKLIGRVADHGWKIPANGINVAEYFPVDDRWYFQLDANGDGDAEFLIEDSNEGSPILDYTRNDEDTPAAVTTVGSPDTLQIIVNDSGNGDGEFQVRDGLGGTVLRAINPDSGRHLVNGQGEQFRLVEIAPVLPQGDYDCGDYSGEVGFDTICDLGGVLHVRHGTDAPIPLESQVVGASNERFFSSQVEPIPVGANNVLTWTPPGNPTSQGNAFLKVRVVSGVGGEDVDTHGAIYEITARVTYGVGAVTVEFSNKVEDEGASVVGQDCVLVPANPNVNLQCTSVEPSTQWTSFISSIEAFGGPN